MVYKTLTVALPLEAAEKLDALARESYRRPKDQAGVLLLEAIERAVRRPRKDSAR